MPSYDYQCFACDHTFELVQRITEDSITTCPKCGKEEVKRIIAASSFRLKGSGWYATDYGGKGSASSSDSSAKSSPAPSAEKKSSSSD